MKRLRWTPRDGDEEQGLTKAMTTAVRHGGAGHRLSAATAGAMEKRGLIRRTGGERWHWTPQGIALVRRHKHTEE